MESQKWREQRPAIMAAHQPACVLDLFAVKIMIDHREMR